jgi:L-lactate dehydrogenase
MVVCITKALLDGEYGEENVYIGVPAVINLNGVREIMQLNLNDKEQALFRKSASILRQNLSTYFG